MPDKMMARRDLMEKSAGADLLHEIIGFAAEQPIEPLLMPHPNPVFHDPIQLFVSLTELLGALLLCAFNILSKSVPMSVMLDAISAVTPAP